MVKKKTAKSGGKKPTHYKLKYKKNINVDLEKAIEDSGKPKANKRAAGKRAINTTGLDVDKLGNIGKFVKMDDTELMEHVPTGGKGHGNNLSEDEIDSRLVLVHRMQLRGFTIVEMAEKLEISTRMVSKIKLQIREVHRRSFTNIDINEWLGSTMAFFDEVRDVSMMMSSTTGHSPKDRVGALNTALKAELSKAAFLSYCGVFDYIKQNQSLISEVIEHRSDEEVDEVFDAMDSLALELFGADG